jgi:cytochrome c oxidase assembly factor CtaG
MPFHAFFAVAVLSGGAIIGQNFYLSLGLPWLHDLAAQQRAGGQVTWATGEIPLFIVIIALVGQWFRQDQREARRKDRAADSGHDDSLAAYNEMLAALAARDRADQQRESGRDQEHDGGVRS